MQTIIKTEVALCLTELHVDFKFKKVSRGIIFIIGKTNLDFIEMGQWLRACSWRGLDFGS